MVYREYVVVGRGLPTKTAPRPTIYRMRIFAKDHVVAKSRFWYFVNRLKKVKKSQGEIIAVEKVKERKPLVVKNFGIFLRYNSRTGTHNMYKEFRDLSRTGAVGQLYSEMASRHAATERSIQIIQVAQLSDAQCKRVHVKQFHDATLKFPLPHHIVRPSHKRLRRTFLYKRPNALPM
eukprot:TRINITY_DN166_c0_g1_i1.p1 TRINITY_DN166_c0_g1~~TRINITY_DN166_c0_g1_i1.p1  ORF type:complete len:177 (+),score=28.66 TRINITY_DN166_c0_g1_i1:444-974(+)